MNARSNNKMDNLTFLSSLIEKVAELNNILVDQKICIKDSNSLTIYTSEAFANFIGVSPILDVTSELVLHEDSSIKNIILEEDRLVLNARKSQTTFKISNINGTLKPFICIKSPIVNPHNNEVVGIYVYCIENGIYSLLNVLTQDKNLVPEIKNQPYLNRREKQVVFLFLSHLSSSEIAQVLSQLDNKVIKKSTIDSVFNDQLYIKFEVNSRPGLYAKLVKLGYNYMIPQEILSIKSLFIDQQISY